MLTPSTMASWPSHPICVDTVDTLSVDNVQEAPETEDNFLSILSTHLSLLGDALGKPECGGSSDLAIALLSSRTAIARALGDSTKRSAGPRATSLPTPKLESESRPGTATGDRSTKNLCSMSTIESEEFLPHSNSQNSQSIVKKPPAPAAVKLPWAETPMDAPAVLDVDSGTNKDRSPVTLVGSKVFSRSPTVTFRTAHSEHDEDMGALLHTPDDINNYRSLRDAATALKDCSNRESQNDSLVEEIVDNEVAETASMPLEEVKDVQAEKRSSCPKDILAQKRSASPTNGLETQNGRSRETKETHENHHDIKTYDDRLRELGSDTIMEMGWFSEESNQKGYFHEVVKGRCFEVFFAFLIVANAGYIAYDTDWQVKHPTDKPPLSHQIIDVSFLCVFTIEVIIRGIADGSDFLSAENDDRPWNLFDVLVIVSSWVDEILYLLEASGSISMSALRVLRVLRLMRVVRVVRVVRFFRDLRVMVFGIMNSMRTLSWAVLLLMLIIFVFAVTLVQAVAEELSEAEPSEQIVDDLLHLYGSLLRAIYTLYCSVCGGLDWDDAAGPLMEFNVFLGFLFCVYVALAVLCVLNIVTGLFVENASKMITRDEDHMLLEELEHRKHWLEDCKRLFHSADNNNDCKIDLEEFTSMVKNVKMQAKLRHLGIELNEANHENVFRLLDVDGDGNVDLEEFVASLQQLEGGARAIDLVYLMRDMRAVRRQLQALSDEFGLPAPRKSSRVSTFGPPKMMAMESVESNPREKSSMSRFTMGGKMSMWRPLGSTKSTLSTKMGKKKKRGNFLGNTKDLHSSEEDGSIRKSSSSPRMRAVASGRKAR